MTIQTIQQYQRLAQNLAVELFNMSLNIPVEKVASGNNSGSFYHKRNEKKSVKITLNLKQMKTHDEVIDTLKHELAHWYCYEKDLAYKDGQIDFERELLRIGASSTHEGYGNKEKSQFIQKAVINGQMNRQGFKGLTYKTIDKSEAMTLLDYTRPTTKKHEWLFEKWHYKKAIEVRYNGEHIATLVHAYGNWFSIYQIDRLEKDYYMRFFNTRKAITNHMVLDLETQTAK